MKDPDVRTRWPYVTIVAAMTAIIVILGLAALVFAYQSRHEALASAEGEARLHNRALEQHLSQTFDVVGLALRGLGTKLGQRPLEANELADTQTGFPFIRSLSVVNAEGVIAVSTQRGNVGVRVSQADFLPPLDASVQTIRVGRPWRGRDFENGQPTTAATPALANELTFIPMALPVNTAQGVQLLMVSVNPGFFLVRYDEELESAIGSVEVLRYDGVVLFSNDPLITPGSMHTGSDVLLRLGRAASGSLEYINREGRQYLSAYSARFRLPLVVLTHLRRDTVLENWQTNFMPVLALVGALSLLLLALGGLYGWTRLRQRSVLDAAAHDEQKRLAALMNALPAGLVMLDMSGTIVRANDYWVTLVSELPFAVDAGGQGRNYLEVLRRVCPRSKGAAEPPLEACIRRVLENASDRSEHELHTVREGAYPWFNVYVRPVHEAGFDGILLMWLNISERKALEADEKRSNALLLGANNLLRESLRELSFQKFALDEHAVVSITDVDGIITYVNEKFVRTSGYGREELLGQSHRMLKSDLHPRSFYIDMWHTIASGKVWHGELANRRKNGEVYWMASTIVPKLGEHGVPEQYIAMRTEITAQKHAEQALSDAHRREMETGREIQEALLQGKFPARFEGGYAATHAEPSQDIDGDFFAFFQYSPTCFDVLVGDVMGKGIHAALIGAALKAAYSEETALLLTRGLASSLLPGPASIMNAMNQRLTPRLIALESYATVGLYRVDLEQQSLTFVNGGHTPALLCSRASGTVEVVLGRNMPIGVLLDEIYVEDRRPLRPGDGLLVYSDGVTDAISDEGEAFGQDRLELALGEAWKAQLPPAMVVQYLRLRQADFATGDRQVDDQTMVMFELERIAAGANPAPSGTASSGDSYCVVDWELERLGIFRTFIETAARELDPDIVDVLALASFEAITNIIRHVSPPLPDAQIVCHARREPLSMTFDFYYLGPLFSGPEAPEPDFSGESEGGFGLFIIRSLLDEVHSFEPLPGVVCMRMIKRLSP